jgi:precorrin-2 methylase
MVAGIATTIKDHTLEKSEDNKGILYGVSVGPGNSQMVTPQAIVTLNGVSVIAIPETKLGNTIALEIISDLVNFEVKEIMKFQFQFYYYEFNLN